MQQHDIFPINVFVTKAKRHTEIVEYFNKNIIPAYEKTQESNTSACNVFSDYFEGAPRLNQEQIGNLYQEDISEFLQHLKFNPNLNWNLTTSYWYSITNKGGWQEAHCHIGGPRIVNFSAVHYVKFSKEHTPLRFFNPMDQVIKATFPSESAEDNPFMFNNLKVVPPVEEGDLIIFPSYLRHDVPLQTSNKTRISVAMNIGITKQ